MEEARSGLAREITLSKALILLIAALLIVSGIGTAVGYTFFWNKYEKVSKEDAAVTQAMTYVEKYPKDYRSYLAVGAVYLRKDDPMTAMEWFKKADQMKKGDLTVKYNMGLAYFAMKNYDEAVKLMTPLAEKNQMNFEVHYYLGGVYYAKGDYDKAIERFKWTLMLQPGAADANLFAAKAYYKKGDKKYAQLHLEKALKMVPNYKEALEFKEAMTANKPID